MEAQWPLVFFTLFTAWLPACSAWSASAVPGRRSAPSGVDHASCLIIGGIASAAPGTPGRVFNVSTTSARNLPGADPQSSCWAQRSWPTCCWAGKSRKVVAAADWCCRDLPVSGQ